jgi:hypothetical protein
MSVGILHHKYLTGAVQKIKPMPAVAAAAFGTPKPSRSPKVSIDIIRGAETLVPFRSPRAEAGVNERTQIESIEMTLGTIREKVEIPADDLKWLRRPGSQNDVYAQQQIALELAELRRKAERRLEFHRWELMRSGQMNIPIALRSGSTTLKNYNFAMAAAHLPDMVSGSEPWSDISTDIVGHLKAWLLILDQDAYITDTVMGYMMNNTGIKALINDRPQEFTFTEGRIQRFMGLDWRVFNKGYVNSSGTYKAWINQEESEQHCIIKVPGVVGDEYTAPFPDTKAGDRQTGFFSKSFETEDPSAVWILVGVTQSPALTRPEDVLTAKVA